MTVVMTGRSVLVGLMYYLHAGMTRLGLSWTPHPTLRRPWTLRSLSSGLPPSLSLRSHQPVLDKCGDGQMLGQ